MFRGRQCGLVLGQAHGLETRAWEEDVAKGDLPTMPLKRLCCSEGEESEIHPSIPEGSAGGRRAGGATKELFMGPGSRSAKDGA